MKSRSALLVLTCSLLLGSSGPVFADDTATVRLELVTSIHAKYDPLFDAQYARLISIKSKIANNASMLPAFKIVLADFLGVRKFLDTSLNSSTADLDTIISYAEEELGEFTSTLYLLDTQIVKSKTITCAKGKTIKKVMAFKPVCPKGYLKK